MKTEHEIADIIFDVCRKFNLKTNNVVKWIIVCDHLHNELNQRELSLANLVVNKLEIKGYIRLERESGTMPMWLRLLEPGYDYMCDENAVLDLSVPIHFIPEGEPITLNEAFNVMWKWVGESDSPKYLTGTELYKLMLEVNNDLPPTYNQFLVELRSKGKSTSRQTWLYEIYSSLSEKQQKIFLSLVESKINEISTVPVTSIDQNDKTRGFDRSYVIQEKRAHPSVFISYSWDDENHKKWVLKLADHLMSKGINVILDQYDLRLGKDISQFCENAIIKADRILVIGTPEYKSRAESRTNGVGFEYSIISSDMMNKLDTDRFIPILRSGTMEESFPLLLQKRKGVIMNDDANYENAIDELVREIYNEPKIQRPPLGEKPDFSK